MLKYIDLDGGHWKTKDNTIEERLPSGEWFTRFTPISASNTPFYMEQLCSQFSYLWNKNSIDRLVIIFAFIFDFLCIHPFSDGNGPISRLLTVLLLHKINIDVTRYISYERLIEDTKESYYEILYEASKDWHHRKHRLLIWLEYNLGLLIAAYKEFEDRVNIIDFEKGSKTSWILEIINNLPEEFSIGHLTRLCPSISRSMIRHVLESLRREGKITSISAGRTAKWRKI